jgi:hypothetical protein
MQPHHNNNHNNQQRQLPGIDVLFRQLDEDRNALVGFLSLHYQCLTQSAGAQYRSCPACSSRSSTDIRWRASIRWPQLPIHFNQVSQARYPNHQGAPWQLPPFVPPVHASPFQQPVSDGVQPVHPHGAPHPQHPLAPAAAAPHQQEYVIANQHVYRISVEQDHVFVGQGPLVEQRFAAAEEVLYKGPPVDDSELAANSFTPLVANENLVGYLLHRPVSATYRFIEKIWFFDHKVQHSFTAPDIVENTLQALHTHYEQCGQHWNFQTWANAVPRAQGFAFRQLFSSHNWPNNELDGSANTGTYHHVEFDPGNNHSAVAGQALIRIRVASPDHHQV